MDINSKNLDYIFEALSKKHGYSKAFIKSMIRSQFEFTKEVMKTVDSYNNYWPSVRLPKFCVFTIKKGKRRYYRERSLKILENVYNQQREQDSD